MADDTRMQVHHIDGKGHDSGVVYCEMQACENIPVDLIENRFLP